VTTINVLQMFVILGWIGLVVELARNSPWIVIAVVSAAVITIASRIR
jgi:hypothetical protein